MTSKKEEIWLWKKKWKITIKAWPMLSPTRMENGTREVLLESTPIKCLLDRSRVF